MFCSAVSLEAQIRIEIPKPGEAGVPIAIAPLSNPASHADGEIGQIFAEVIARDLELSGLFRVLDRLAYIEGPDGFVLEQINFRNWSVLNALALAKGGFWIEGERLIIEARLFDVTQRKQLGGKRYQGVRADVRRMAHRFADQIMLFLTGEEGPFNSQIAFVSNRADGRAKEVYRMDVSGTAVRRVTRDRTLSLGPSWSPSGEDLLFISYKRGGPYPYRLNLANGKTSRVYAKVGYGANWSPDGKMVAVNVEQRGNADLFLITPQGKLIRRLTNHAGIDVSPAWSPDGRRLAFCSDRSGSPQIYVMDVETGRFRRLTFRGRYNTDPAWSPKGDRLAYTARSGGFRIMSINPAGGEATEVGRGEHPSWSPDGRYLAVTRRGRIYMLSRYGRNIKQLTGGRGNDTSPSWSPRFR
jgi:TolB protein